MSKASLELGGGNWGTKDGNLLAYAQGNESSKFVPREFTFTRGSDIAATRINSSGLIEKYRENLFTQSNNFSDSDWNTTSGSSFVGGQSGYDGTSDAWLFTDSGAASAYGAYQDKVINGVHTYSIYVKEGSTSTFVIDSFQSPRPSVTIDLTNGNVTASDEIDAKSELISNGWYRLSLTFNASSTLYMRLGCNGAGSVYIQDAQLERGLVATSYLESGATTATSGVADNEPRIDYTGGTASLLLEPSRTNIATYSEYMLGFNKGSASSLEANAAISPDGKSNATYFYCNTTTTNAYLLPSFSGTSGVQYAVSFYAKAKELNRIYIKNVNDSGSQSWFDLSDDGTYNLLSGIDSMSIELAGDGWYRCTAVSTSTTTGIKWVPILKGDANEGVYVYGLQIEQASYATSYIPTYGTSVTRAADGQTLDITNLISSTEGTLFFHLKDAKSHSQTNKILGIGDGSGVDNFFGLYVNDFQTGAVGIRNRQANADLMNTAIPNPQNAKVAIKFSPSGVKTFLNGLEFQSSATAYTGWATSFDLNTTVGDVDLKQYLLFNEALTDKEAVDLTSPYSTYQELVTAEGLTWESPTCTTNSITELQSI